MRFDDAFLEQVRASISIVDLVGRYVHLKKKGKDHAALCPFHLEKTPSFLVSESKQIFKCFGCGAGGDVFKFIMLIENLPFPESIQYLAESYGIPIPQSTQSSPGADHQRSRLLEVLGMANYFFQRCLQEHQQARQYLARRQISAETASRFELGYAPLEKRLSDELKEKGVSSPEALACGLVKEGDTGQVYDKFRDRIMFPIRDLTGRTIAFGGRSLGDRLPKYLNSPDTPLYSKSKTLYPMDITRDEIRRRDFAILVEGYFDCIAPFQAGTGNVVASLGTSLTEDQVKLLGRYTRNVVTAYDPDSAGITATIRSIDLFLEQGFRINVLRLPAGQDPDTFIREQGVDAYRKQLRASEPYLDFTLSQFVQRQRDPHSPRGKQEIVSQILPYLVKVPNKIERAEQVSRIAARLQLDENLILGELRKTPGARERRLPLSPQFSVAVEPVTPAEDTLLVALLEEQWAEQVLAQIDTQMFEGLRTAPVIEAALVLKERGEKVTPINLSGLLSDAASRDLVEQAAMKAARLPLSDEVIRNSSLALRKKQLDRYSVRVQQEIREEEKRDDGSQRLKELLAQKEQIQHQRKELENSEVSLSPESTGK